MESLPVILLAFANNHTEETEKLRYLRKEHNRIKEILEAAESKGLCELIVLPFATIEEILNQLQDQSVNNRIAILHFSGHAGTDQLLLEAEQGDPQVIDSNAFNHFLRHAKALRLVFLNACATEAQARGLQQKYPVPLIIGTTQRVKDEIACEIAIGFYQGLGKGLGFEDAWQDAEKKILATHSTANSYRGIVNAGSGDRKPWELYVREGSEAVKKESLPALAGNPLFHLALPKHYYDSLPKPFLSIHRFEEKHAPVFFGRGREIRDLYQLVTGTCPIILFYGESGTGKSSLLEAGLFPRIKGDYCVVPVRRSADYGLRGTLGEALARYCPDRSVSLREQWFTIETQQDKPLLIILDQAEEAFTKPLAEGTDKEWKDLLGELKLLFDDPGTKPKGKIILSFRKEYLPEIKKLVAEDYELPRKELFLEKLKREGIIEAIEGLTKHPETRQAYNLEIEAGLPGLIADDLLEDANSAISPVLQILLTRLWDEEQDKHTFTRKRYLEIKKKGIHLSDFLREKLEALSREGYAEAVDKGLVLNLLYDHTTPMGTANALKQENLVQRYAGQQENLSGLLDKLVDHYLLFRFNSIDKDTKQSVTYYSLCHDTLAPVVLQSFRSSDRPGQRALRLLESKQQDIAQGTASFKDTDDIAVLEAGRPFMRAWTHGEEDALSKGKEALAAQYAREAAMRQSNLDFALARINDFILHLNYEFAFQETRKALGLNYGQAQLALLLEEMGFVFHASGQSELAREAFQELLGLELPQYVPLEATLPEALDSEGFYPLLNNLDEIENGAGPLIRGRYLGEMIYVEGGSFMMGSDEDDSEKPIHQVMLNSFFLQKTQVTYWQYSLFMQREGLQTEKPGWGRQGDNPAVYVNWYESTRYCNWRSLQEGLQPAYQMEGDIVHADWQSNGYRLPSEAEWEYSARGGTYQQPFQFSGGDDLDIVGWYDQNAQNRTQSVASKLPNILKIFDMSGNAYEWCWDYYDKDYYKSSQFKMPKGPDFGYHRVSRGGSWGGELRYSCVFVRGHYTPVYCGDFIGFRQARTI